MHGTRAARTLRTAFGVTVFAVVASAGCGNLIGLDDYEEVDEVQAARAGNCNVAFLPPACRSCVASQCASECSDCRANPQCVAMLSCLNDCAGTETCLADCQAEHEGGVDDFYGVYADDACAFTTCGSVCSPAREVGEPCNVNSQCASAGCTFEGGWCTDVCTSSSQCPDYCSPVGEDALCFVACDSNADCESFPSTTCQPYVSVEGSEIQVCHP
jgi:hypothetical protein